MSRRPAGCGGSPVRRGTTSERSKYLPVTDVSLWRCHTRGLRDVATLYAGQYPSTRVFEGKTLTLGGTCSKSGGIVVGDLSALLVERTPFWSGWFRTPRRETALLADFDEKARTHLPRVRIGAGHGLRRCPVVEPGAVAPRWWSTRGAATCARYGRIWNCSRTEAWGSNPTVRRSANSIPSAGMHYMETYNASEGFFAIADDASRDDMLLMLDYGTYYEFRDGDEVVPLEGVQAGRRYAMLISSCNGLWRYELGDVVEFTSTDPYRIRVAGRTRQFINAFGEEVVMENAERAVKAVAAEATGAVVSEYTAGSGDTTLHGLVAPTDGSWSLGRAPESFDAFVQKLDGELMRLNSDLTQVERRSTIGAARDACRSGGERSPAGCFGAAKTRSRALPTTAGCWRMCWRRRPNRMRR